MPQLSPSSSLELHARCATDEFCCDQFSVCCDYLRVLEMSMLTFASVDI